MNNNLDERQMQIQGKIMKQGVLGIIVVLMLIALVDSFDLFPIHSYVDLPDLMIVLCLLLVTFLSLSLIWRDAYFGIASVQQMRVIMMVFVTLMIAEDILFAADLVQGEGITAVTVFSLMMVNSIALSMLYKRKDW